MLKTIDEAKSTLENEDENFVFDIGHLNSLRLKLNKEIPMSSLKKQAFSISSPALNNALPNKKYSVMFENSFLESEKETIKSAFIKSREEFDTINVRSSSFITNPLEKSKENSLRDFKEGEENESHINFPKEILNEISPLKTSKKGKIYINRRNIYFDKDGRNLFFC